LTTTAQQQTGSSLIFGGSGQEITRNVLDVQFLAVDASGGKFTLSLDAQTTGALNYNAPASATATVAVTTPGVLGCTNPVETLTNIGAGNVLVSSTTSGSITTYMISFLASIVPESILPASFGEQVVHPLTVAAGPGGLTGTASILATASGDMHARDADAIAA